MISFTKAAVVTSGEANTDKYPNGVNRWVLNVQPHTSPSFFYVGAAGNYKEVFGSTTAIDIYIQPGIPLQIKLDQKPSDSITGTVLVVWK